jgi:hypothetical protein
MSTHTWDAENTDYADEQEKFLRVFCARPRPKLLLILLIHHLRQLNPRRRGNRWRQ